MNCNKEEIDKMPEIDRNKLMKNWTDSEWTDFFCPNGTMPIEDLRKYAYEITED